MLSIQNSFQNSFHGERANKRAHVRAQPQPRRRVVRPPPSTRTSCERGAGAGAGRGGALSAPSPARPPRTRRGRPPARPAQRPPAPGAWVRGPALPLSGGLRAACLNLVRFRFFCSPILVVAPFLFGSRCNHAEPGPEARGVPGSLAAEAPPPRPAARTGPRGSFWAQDPARDQEYKNDERAGPGGRGQTPGAPRTA